MTIRDKLRNRLTGYIFGKYVLEKQIEGTLIKGEEYISGIEIIFYDELMLLLALFGSIASLTLGIIIDPLFFLILIPITSLVYFSLEVELIYLTSERLIIERRTILEKLLKTSNIKSISLDQVAVISYSRAPFQYPSLFLSALGFVTIILSFVYDVNAILIVIVLLPISLYLAYFGSRLTKRSIEISVIGVLKPFGVGRTKGAPLWFLNDLQNMIFERVHHTLHDDEEGQDLHENPLKYSGRVKELLKLIKKPLQKKILQLLDENVMSKGQIVEQCAEYSKTEVDEAMRQLRAIRYIYYHRGIKKWCLDQSTVISDLEDSE
ncbi:MAG: hypothetical protein GPJ54_02090 [Candidatus Heimdallarchaeota archaeon]|nr:hypothetical protein [Candidatus Heimdallarchaeota archaeon]